MLSSGIILLGVTMVWPLASASLCRLGEENSAISPHQQGFLERLEDSRALGEKLPNFQFFK